MTYQLKLAAKFYWQNFFKILAASNMWQKLAATICGIKHSWLGRGVVEEPFYALAAFNSVKRVDAKTTWCYFFGPTSISISRIPI